MQSRICYHKHNQKPKTFSTTANNNFPVPRRIGGPTWDEVANGATHSFAAVNHTDVVWGHLPIRTNTNATAEDRQNEQTQPSNNVAQDEAKAALIEECEDILADNPALLVNDTLLKVAGVFTNAEIVEKANSARASSPLSSRLISDRLVKAISRAAEQHRKTRDQVKSELDATRRANGVTQRKHAYASAKRVASVATKKEESSTPEPEAMNVDDDRGEGAEEEDVIDDENPLEDLNEMVRRELEGSLDDGADHEETESSPMSPRPFGSRPVGFEVLNHKGSDA